MGWSSVQYALCKRTVLQLEVKNIYTGIGSYAVILIEIYFNDEWEFLAVFFTFVESNTAKLKFILLIIRYKLFTRSFW